MNAWRVGLLSLAVVGPWAIQEGSTRADISASSATFVRPAARATLSHSDVPVRFADLNARTTFSVANVNHHHHHHGYWGGYYASYRYPYSYGYYRPYAYRPYYSSYRPYWAPYYASYGYRPYYYGYRPHYSGYRPYYAGYSGCYYW